jgi:hypothetical protein
MRQREMSTASDEEPGKMLSVPAVLCQFDSAAQGAWNGALAVQIDEIVSGEAWQLTEGPATDWNAIRESMSESRD